jgi:ATP-dependent phosphofructokinase / diphosphate-dependent phosphofructokinase
MVREVVLMPRTGNVVIAQGGGPTAVINASLYAIVRAAMERLGATCDIWGARNGITGVLRDQWINLSSVGGQLGKQIADSPGAALGSCRKMLNAEEAAEAVRALMKKDVRYFFYVGGNDSMDTALKMNQAALALPHEMACCGIPKTIDNDLPCTDHCPGFGSAARYIAQSAADLGMDVRSLPTPVSVLEVMGRDAGWLTAATVLARRNPDDAPHLIYVPEVPLEAKRFLTDVQKAYDRLGWVVAAVSEGVRDESGESWGARRKETTTDGFGHRLPGDVAATLASLVTSELGLRARSEKPGLLGRASSLMVSSTDRREAEEVGAFGFSWALNGHTGFMASIERQPGAAYGVTYSAVPLEKVADQTRLLPLDYVTKSRSDIKEEYRAYAEPLIGGPLAQYASLDTAPSVRANFTKVGH